MSAFLYLNVDGEKRMKKKFLKVITTVVTFSTTTAAMKMEKTARESEFQGRLIPIPSEISAQCGLAWKCVEQSEEETEDFLKKKELAWDGIYRVLV